MITIVSERRPGEPKLKKPKELKGVKPFMSYKWGGVTTCQAFMLNNDIWINHHDWCSITIYGAKNKYKQHFVYSDGFTAPTFKGDAWIRFSGILKYPNRSAVIRGITHECLELDKSRFCMDDERMFVDVYIKAKELDDTLHEKLKEEATAMVRLGRSTTGKEPKRRPSGREERLGHRRTGGRNNERDY